MAGGLMCTFLLCLAAPLVSANGQERNDAALHSREQQIPATFAIGTSTLCRMCLPIPSLRWRRRFSLEQSSTSERHCQ